MQEFFTKKQTESISRPDGKGYTCVACGLYKTAKTPRMKPFGNFKKGIMCIGEAPGEVEDRVGKPFQGKTGKLLEQTLMKLGVNLFEDCININACYCRPMDDDGGNRAPTNYEIESCRRTTLQYVREYKPKVIILLGNSAVYSVIGHRWKRDLGGITKWRGWTIPDQDLTCWVCPTFHPSYVERTETTDVSTIWIDDLKRAIACLKTPFPKYKEPTIDIIEDLTVLNTIKGGDVAVDYETTGIKPHAEGHRIVCAAVADTPDHVYAFMMPPSKQARKPFLDLLTNEQVGKIAQNMKFEDTWSIVRLRQQVVNWVWDTMLATHVMDNRPGITGLKFQVYVQFGIPDYDSDVAPYLSAKDNNNANALNRILDVLNLPGGKNMLLKYCALDSVYEYRLARLQQSEIILPF
jgi:uracil-DNA glycosylase